MEIRSTPASAVSGCWHLYMAGWQESHCGWTAAMELSAFAS